MVQITSDEPLLMCREEEAECLQQHRVDFVGYWVLEDDCGDNMPTGINIVYDTTDMGLIRWLVSEESFRIEKVLNFELFSGCQPIIEEKLERTYRRGVNNGVG